MQLLKGSTHIFLDEQVELNQVSIMVDSILSVFKNVSKNNIINTALANGIAVGDVASVKKLIEEKTVCIMIDDHLDQNHRV